MRHYAKEQRPRDKKKVVREVEHLTRPPRLEGVVKNAKMNPVRKPPRKDRGAT